MSTPSNAAKRWPRLLIGVVALLILLVGGLWWWLASDPLFSDYQEQLTTAQIENIGRIELPPSAAGVQARAGGFQDRFIVIRFEMLPAELDTFLKATRYTPAISLTTTIPFQSIADDAPWWRPQDAQRFAAGQSFVDGISQAVLVDMTRAERYIVYIQTFET